jgi:putative restriction endonuclease
MRFFVAVTDGDWFNFLASSAPHDEVNFWQPSASRQFRALNPGELFLFKLHSPLNYIVGGGFFLSYKVLPVGLAWDAYTTKNGAESEKQMRKRIAHYRKPYRGIGDDYEIGCIMLQSPFFFSQELWIRASDWASNIVQGKSYDTSDWSALQLWTNVIEHLPLGSVATPTAAETSTSPSRFGLPYLVTPRLGQSSFRVFVTDAYQRRCAFTNSPVLHVLAAAHIRPFADEGPHDVRNGILLRQDVHTLFDRGYLTVTPDYRIEVSSRIKDEFDNGREYYASQGKQLTVPRDPESLPAREYLEWHNENIYLG